MSVIRVLLLAVLLHLISDIAMASSDSPPQWAMEFARSYEDAVNRRDLTAVSDAIDADTLFQLAVANLQINQPELAQLREHWSGSRGLATLILQMLGDEGHCRLVRVRQRYGSWTALYRMVGSGGDFNYHEALLARRGDESVAILDFHFALSGEWWSETFNRLFHLTTGGRRQAEVLSLFNRFVRLYEEGRFEEALDAWELLPRRFHQDKGVHLLRVLAAAYVGDSEGAAAAEAFAQQFPGDPSLDLVLMDARVLREQYSDLLKSIDRMRDTYGDHAWLDYQQAAVLMWDGRVEEAKAFLKRSLEREQDLIDPRWLLISIALEEGDHQEVATQLEIIESAGILILDLRELPKYEEFVTSEAYKQWMARRDYRRETDEFEMQWLIESRLIGHGLIARYRTNALQEDDVFSVVDNVIKQWLSDASEDAPGDFIVTRGLGAIIGDEIARISDLRWIIAYTPKTDEYFGIGDLNDSHRSNVNLFDPFELVEQQIINHQPGRILESIREREEQ